MARRGGARPGKAWQARHGEARPGELLAHTPLSEYQVRRRLTDLLHAGKVRQGEARLCSAKGTKMVTWFPREA